MKKMLLLATVSLGGFMFAQTPAVVENPAIQALPVAVETQVVQPAPVAIQTPPVVQPVPGIFTIGADLRTRSELDNGQRTIMISGESPENTIFSRARLNLDYKKDKLTLRFSPQMVRVWGETNSIRLANPGVVGVNTAKVIASDFDVYEAWAQYAINPNWAIKVGRMPLSYDDERLFGALDWQMQGRNFDAAKLIYTKNKAKFELVGTYNNDNTGFSRDANGEEAYTLLDGGERTKSLQIAYYENAIGEKFKFSLIGVHNVVQVNPIITPSHNSLFTFGTNPRYKLNDKLTLYGSAYLQTGKDSGDKVKSAFQYSANLEFKPTAKITSTLGTEVLSGTRPGATDNNAFSPFYGTNHKFNGYMDYFFVGNHFNTVGLNDYYLKSTFKLSPKGTLLANAHAFLTNQQIVAASDSYLGTEIDLVYTQKVSDVFSYNIGYSQMIASDNMRILKARPNYNDNQSWAWVQLIFSPKIFTATIN